MALGVLKTNKKMKEDIKRKPAPLYMSDDSKKNYFDFIRAKGYGSNQLR
jgi:hypothetical protein